MLNCFSAFAMHFPGCSAVTCSTVAIHTSFLETHFSISCFHCRHDCRYLRLITSDVCDYTYSPQCAKLFAPEPSRLSAVPWWRGAGA